MKILLIDDEPALNKVLSNMLRDVGHQVYQAFNGLEGLEQLRNNPEINIIITDIIMPEKEGLEFIHEIRQKYQDLKIIAMSAGGKISGENYLQLAKNLGADQILKKPFKRKELLERIDKIE